MMNLVFIHQRRNLGEKDMGSYDKGHTIDMCDKCLKIVGFANLKPVPFVYLDRNDHTHASLGNDYHQYFCCDKCYKREVKIWKNTRSE
jgi:hypothetical protein